MADFVVLGQTAADTARETVNVSKQALVDSFTQAWSQVILLAPKMVAMVAVLVIGYVLARWVAGLYYYDQEVDGSYDLDLSNLGFLVFDADYVQDTTSWAVFGQYEQDLAERWTLVAGLRYTQEERELEYLNVETTGFFTDVHHVDHEVVHNPRFFQRNGDGFSLANGGVNVIEGSHKHGVAGCVAGNQQGFKNRNTRCNQRAKSSSDARNGADVQNLPDERDT